MTHRTENMGGPGNRSDPETVGLSYDEQIARVCRVYGLGEWDPVARTIVHRPARPKTSDARGGAA
jgi:hypothetical protein